jgi:iron complex outermembrane receptor protein
MFHQSPRLLLLVFLSALFSLLPLNTSLAQEEIGEEALFRFEEYVVSAAKRLQRIEEAPATITVITEEDIKHSGATNLGDLLRMVPGLEVMELSPSAHEVGARGENKPMSNGILAMVNGRSIYLDFFGVVQWDFIDVPLESIKRIEIIRGPGSALYGANAFHGVVNIITKQVEDFQHANLSFTGGDLNTYIATAIHSGEYEDLGYLLSAGWDQTYHREGEEVSRKNTRGRVSLNYSLSDESKITIEGGVASGESEVFNNSFGLIDGKGALLYNLMLNYQRPKFYLRTFWNKLGVDELYCDDFVAITELPCIGEVCIDVDPSYVFKEELVTNTFDIESQYIFDIGQMNSIVAGADFRYNSVDSTFFDKYHSQALFAGYLQHEFRFRELLTSLLGLRYDYHPQVGDVLSPRGSLIISQFQPHILRLSVGRAFRNPSFMESYANILVPLTPSGEVSGRGYEELLPEKINSYEVGYQTKFLDRVKFNLNLFYNQLEDLIAFDIEYFSISPLSAKVVFANRYNRTALGGEAEVELFITEWLRGSLNYAYTEVKDTDTNEIIKMTPKNKINGGIRLILKNGFSSSLMVHYASDTYWPATLKIEEPMEFDVPLGKTDPYTIVNLRIGYKFLKDKIEVAASAFNLLNDEHKEYPIAEDLGRRIVGTISCGF